MNPHCVLYLTIIALVLLDGALLYTSSSALLQKWIVSDNLYPIAHHKYLSLEQNNRRYYYELPSHPNTACALGSLRLRMVH